MYAIVDNLQVHRATDELLSSLAYERWEFVLPPKYACTLQLIEPRWGTLRSLLFKAGAVSWETVCDGVRWVTPSPPPRRRTPKGSLALTDAPRFSSHGETHLPRYGGPCRSHRAFTLGDREPPLHFD